MSLNTHINNFTAADIEKYHKGQLSAAEMHRLEKAALDDPFLADALEGFTAPGVNVAADMAELKKRLFEKTQDEKVVPLYGKKNTAKPYAWLRIAAAIVIIGGAAVLANQFLFKGDKKTDLAVVSDKTEKPRASTPAIDTTKVSNSETLVNEVTPGNTNQENAVNTKVNTSGKIQDVSSNSTGATEVASTKEVKDKEATAISPLSPVVSPVLTDDVKDDAAKLESKREKSESVVHFKTKQAPGSEAEKARALKNSEDAIASQPAKKVSTDVRLSNNSNLQTRLFRGRITDGSNNGLPFAKVYNPTDNNAGTYTDANGNFTLTYPDSVLNVQVKALGFELAAAQLQTNISNNKVVMQDDRNISQIVISNQRVNSNLRSAGNNNNRQLIEPEPTDGWENYDAYIANNLEVPEEFNMADRRKSGSVQVSFEVDKNGEPINITVDKSLCTSCDKEAIRLVKEGPKFKRKANKNGRTTVTVNF